MRASIGRRAIRRLLLAGSGLVFALMLWSSGGTPETPVAHRAEAQDLEAQALQIERQLLCPRCTNVRLDHCELAICEDMRHTIRERLEAGDTPDNILLFFSNRFGDRVLADLPKEGFNLLLFGWVGGSVLIVGLAGSAVLWQLRRSSTPLPAPLTTYEERWLDEQIDDDERRGTP